VHSVAPRPSRFNFRLFLLVARSQLTRISLAVGSQFARSLLGVRWARLWLASRSPFSRGLLASRSLFRGPSSLLRSPDVQTRQAANAWTMDRPRPSRHCRAASCLVDVPGVRVIASFELGSARVEFRAGRRGLPRDRHALCQLPLVSPQQQFQVRLVRQFLWRRVISIHVDHVHILQVRKLSRHHSACLPALHTNLLPFCECHARSVWHFLPGHNGPGVSKSYSP
jgi:hypothetical protein